MIDSVSLNGVGSLLRWTVCMFVVCDVFARLLLDAYLTFSHYVLDGS